MGASRSELIRRAVRATFGRTQAEARLAGLRRGLRGRAEAVALLTGLVATNDVIASELVRFELQAGAREPELDELEIFCASLEWMPVDADVARTAGALARRFRAAHGGIDDADYLKAASAIVADAELVTTSVRRYPMFAALEPPY